MKFSEKMLSHVIRTLASAVVLGAVTGNLYAQSTTGALGGEAPSGSTISIENDAGLKRDVQVDEIGRYLIQQLPLGTYSVTLRRDDQVVDSRKDVVLTVNTTTEVSFVAGPSELETITVSANRMSAIDVRSVDSRTVLTSEELAKLPLGFSSEDIAKLAPGVVANGAGFRSPTGESVISFGGASAAENAYYINGFNTTDPLNGLGGLTLPYDSISQQEMFTGGFSAKYGRSAGGVLSAIGKRGTNDWRFGARVSYEPDALRSAERNVRYTENGDLYDPKSRNEVSSLTRGLSAGGPIIRDRLFFFGAYELETQTGQEVASIEDTNSFTTYTNDHPRWYAKLDWNITDRNLLEVTGAHSQYKTSGGIYGYNYTNLDRGDYVADNNNTRVGGDVWVGKYTGYLTDRLTVSALYGQMSTDDFAGTPGYNPDLTFVDGLTFQNPAFTGGTPIRNAQTTPIITDPDRGNRVHSLRFDLNYSFDRHNITVGIDNQISKTVDYGEVASGPSRFDLRYGQANPAEPISSGLGIPATGGYAHGAEGYYVVRHDYDWITSVKSKQTAQYVEDNWQATHRLLLSLGLRLDQFINYNGDGDPYIKQTSGQWAPRLGFSFDVRDDARFKVFGNVGRYYLALPLNPAFSAAGAVLNTETYYTYGGIDENGYPTDLTQLADTVSALNQFGVPADPKTVATQGIKPSYQDELILGFSKMAGKGWVYGVKATYRTLKSGVDDVCDRDRVFAKAADLGYDVTYDSNPVSCWLFNPGKDNTFKLVDTNGNYVTVPLSREESGMPEFKRDYYSLNLALEHPFNDKWFGKLDYTFSRSYGTTEGQVLSTIQQSGAAVTVDWDYPSLMENTNGPQNNDHTHQLKLYGYYQLNPQWLVSANLSLISGAPKSALGHYVDPDDPANTDPAGYVIYYHFNNGEPSPPGKEGRLPWLKQLDLGVTYQPEFAGRRLRVAADVFNVLDGQAPIYRNPYSENDIGVPNPLFGAIILRQAPRSLRFTVSYDY